jgi:hypothetical protein
MRPSETNFGPTRYINEFEHDRAINELQARVAELSDQNMRWQSELVYARESAAALQSLRELDLAAMTELGRERDGLREQLTRTSP